ncbi:MAG: immune inhibitor A, partial [Firmicutes bacterium]|nr:immune inhibitor A [Bacillota bacterium]
MQFRKRFVPVAGVVVAALIIALALATTVFAAPSLRTGTAPADLALDVHFADGYDKGVYVDVSEGAGAGDDCDFVVYHVKENGDATDVVWDFNEDDWETEDLVDNHLAEDNDEVIYVIFTDTTGNPEPEKIIVKYLPIARLIVNPITNGSAKLDYHDRGDGGPLFDFPRDNPIMLDLPKIGNYTDPWYAFVTTPDAGYEFDKITIEGGEYTELTGADAGRYQFTESKDYTVTIEFKKLDIYITTLEGISVTKPTYDKETGMASFKIGGNIEPENNYFTEQRILQDFEAALDLDIENDEIVGGWPKVDRNGKTFTLVSIMDFPDILIANGVEENDTIRIVQINDSLLLDAFQSDPKITGNTKDKTYKVTQGILEEPYDFSVLLGEKTEITIIVTRVPDASAAPAAGPFAAGDEEEPIITYEVSANPNTSVDVTFNKNIPPDGITTHDIVTIPLGDPYSVYFPDMPNVAGYEFAGWFTEEDGTVKIQDYTLLTNGAPHTLHARWIKTDGPGFSKEEIMGKAIDPQNWQMNRDRTWADFAPNPVIDWMDADVFVEAGYTNPKALQEIAPSSFNRDPADIQTPIRGALILVDFIDRPFISSEALGSNLFGFGLSTGRGFSETITNNPILNHPERETLAAWWADYLNSKTGEGNNGTTINEFWRENSYGKWGVELIGFGPYTLNGLEFQYNGTGNTGFDVGDRPPSLNFSGSIISEATNAALTGADGKDPWDPDDFDFFFILHSGYDESGVWLNFGMMQWAAITLADAKIAVPDLYGPRKYLTDLTALFNRKPELVKQLASKTGSTQFLKDEAAKIASMETNGTMSEYVFAFPESEFTWADATGNATGTRYVAWTSWAAHVSYWSGAGSWDYVSTKYGGRTRSLRRSIQGENDGMATFAHEFGHISGLGDNYGNPYTARVTAKTEPWELMSRGSFAGPYGDQARWTIPGIESSSVPVHFMAFNKAHTSINYYDEGDVLKLTKEGLASSTPVVAEIVARNIPLNNRKGGSFPNGYYPFLEDDYGLVYPNYYKALQLNFGSGTWADQAILKTAGHSQFLSRLSGTNARMFVEVVQRTGYDSFAPDDGVIISRNDCVVDSHPYDIALIEYVQKDGFGPGIDDAASYTVGHTAQLYDAAFHAGTSFTDTGYYRSEYDPADPHYASEDPRYYAGEGNFSWQKNMLKTGSVQQWEENDNNREIASGETVNEFYDPGNKLHFYILGKTSHDGRKLDDQKQLEFISYSVGVLHDEGIPVEGELKLILNYIEPSNTQGNYAIAHFTLKQSGTEGITDIIRIELLGKLASTVGKFDGAFVLNNLFALEDDEIQFEVYIPNTGDAISAYPEGFLYVKASSESNKTKATIYNATSTITITKQPTSLSVDKGSSGTLSISAKVEPVGEPLYQWFLSNSDGSTSAEIIGATGSTYTLPTTLSVGTYYYYCMVSAVNAPPLRSNIVTVTVNEPKDEGKGQGGGG